MWYQNIRSALFSFLTIHASDGRTDGRTDGQNSDSNTVRCITCSRTVKTERSKRKIAEWERTSERASQKTMERERSAELGRSADRARVANPRPVATIKTGRVTQPITDAADATGLGFATRPGCYFAKDIKLVDDR